MERKPPAVTAFAVIGDPIEHSLSPPLHGAVFAAAGVEARFDVVRVRPDSLAAFISRVRQTGEPAGLNVTIPHKQRIVPLLDDVLGDAALSGAVNVVTVGNGAAGAAAHGNEVTSAADTAMPGNGTFNAANGAATLGNGADGAAARGNGAAAVGSGAAARGNGADEAAATGSGTAGKTPCPEGRRLTGYNTDMEGLLLAVRRCGYDYRGSRVAVFGTGGAALGAICKAALEGAKEVRVFGRNREKAEAAIARAMALDHAAKLDRAAELDRKPGTETVFSFRGAPEAEKLEDVDIFINATPLGLAGYAEDFADTSFLRGLPPGALVYDMVYTPSLTALVSAARARGLCAESGLSMLVLQGLLADALFFGAPKEEWLTEGNFKTGYETLALRLQEFGA